MQSNITPGSGSAPGGMIEGLHDRAYGVFAAAVEMMVSTFQLDDSNVSQLMHYSYNQGLDTYLRGEGT
jgi:hypothetical protein